MKPRLLDLFCGAGGASEGYWRAGFDILGVDVNPQSHYPFEFVQADALLLHSEWEGAFLRKEFALIHASPPCQAFSKMTGRWGRRGDHPDLIGKVRTMLTKAGIPYIIENVTQAPLKSPIVLCGSMFNLKVRRHRAFETSFPLIPPGPCRHKEQGKVIGVYGHAGGRSRRDSITFPNTSDWRDAMGIPWMTGRELAEAIPPAYTEFIGRSFLGL